MASPSAPKDYTVYKYCMRQMFKTASIGNDPLYTPIAMWDPPGNQFRIYSHNLRSSDRNRIIIGDFGFIDAGMYVRVRNCIMPDDPTFHEHRPDPLPPSIPPLALPDSTPLLEEDFPVPSNGCICSPGVSATSIKEPTGQHTVIVENCQRTYGALLYVPQTARKWEIPMKNSKKDVASYFHRHYDGLLRYYQYEEGSSGKRETRDIFLVRGYVKTQMFLTASLAEVTARTLEGFQNSRWPLPRDDEQPTREEMHARNALLRFDFSALTKDAKKPLFSGLFRIGPQRVLYDPLLRRRLPGEPTLLNPEDLLVAGSEDVPLSEEYRSTSPIQVSEASGSQPPMVSPRRKNLALKLEDDQASPSPSEPTSPIPFAERLRKTLDDPHNQCVAIYPVRYRARSWIPKIFAQAEPQDPEYHRDDDTGPAVASQDKTSSDADEEDPLHHLLNYILKYSDADAAVADIEDVVFALQGHAEVQDFRAFLEKTRPRIYVSDENVGTLYMDCYLPDEVTAALSARISSEVPSESPSLAAFQETRPATVLPRVCSDVQRGHLQALARHSSTNRCSESSMGLLEFPSPLSVVCAF